VANFDLSMLGERVVCPACGKEGRVRVLTVRRGMKRFYYLTVRHGRRGRCVLRSLTQEEVASYERLRERYGRVVDLRDLKLELLERRVEELAKRLEELERRLGTSP